MNLLKIGDQIRQARRMQDITQNDLCSSIKQIKGVKLNQRELSLIEQGKGNPTLVKIEAIAQVLGKEWLLTEIKE